MHFEIPCLPGERVYFIDTKTEKEGRKRVTGTFINTGIVDHVTIGEKLSPIITVCDDENTWTDFDISEEMGKTLFTTHGAAILKFIENRRKQYEPKERQITRNN